VEIKEVTQRAHKSGVPVYVTLNAPFYTPEGITYLLRLSQRLVGELGTDGLIVSDLNLVIRMRREGLQSKIHLSSLGGCINSKSADYFHSLGVTRIILPRQLRLSEIGRLIAAANSELEFEVFALNDGCYFEEGLCQTNHALGPLCLMDWTVESFSDRENGFPSHEVREHLGELKEYLWYQNNCGSSFQSGGLPNGPCSLCWFGHFRDWNVTAVKIAGREASFHRKMGSVQLVKAVVDEVEGGLEREGVARRARSFRGTPEYCDRGYMCYFRDP
jgi:putative protease